MKWNSKKYVNIIHLEDETIEKKKGINKWKEILFVFENRGGEEANDDSNESNLRQFRKKFRVEIFRDN